MDTFLVEANARLGWPAPETLLHPVAPGVRVYADLARRKIEQALRRNTGREDIRVSVLPRDPQAQATEEPLAIVCEFGRPATSEALREAHRLGWNFCRAKLLVLAEPQRLHVWTCCEPPDGNDTLPGQGGPEIESFQRSGSSKATLDDSMQALHFLRLSAGEYFERHPSRFRREGRADALLLENLRWVRRELIKTLDEDTAHDLLARIIFIQFLFDRRDSSGEAALNEGRLTELYDRGSLSKPYRSLHEILANHADAYALFRVLNDRFNGDLFPGKGQTPEERDREWQKEQDDVRPEHLGMLSSLVEGRLDMGQRQRCLWKQYAFDAFPLELISSIYEEFIGEKRGVHYTPSYLVDFVLDGVLPWDSERWDLRVLDPACGSGIFLVKAFQRLVHLWRRKNGSEIDSATLTRIAEKNLLGIDVDPHAVRVASFSLYLAMCDEIDPKRYWTDMKFPRLRGKRLLKRDFFEDDREHTSSPRIGKHDVIIGNAPWGEGTLTPLAVQWAQDRDHQWPIVNKNIGPLFLAKATLLTEQSGVISMLEPANTLLFNRKSAELRKKLFEELDVIEVVNLSALRFRVLREKRKGTEGAKKAKPQICIVTLRPGPPRGQPIVYISPKPHDVGETESIIIEPLDVHELSTDEAARDPWVWTALAWGNRRDLDFLHRLARFPRLASIKESRNGLVRGGERARRPPRRQDDIVGWRILDAPSFPDGAFLSIMASKLPTNQNPLLQETASTNLAAFQPPQMLVHRTPDRITGRFRSVLVKPESGRRGALCSDAYVSFHSEDSTALAAACVALNSSLASYFLRLTSGRIAGFFQQSLPGDLSILPVPEGLAVDIEQIRSFSEVDEIVRAAFRIKESEWVLVEDFLRHVVPAIYASGSTGATKRVKPAEPQSKAEIDLEPYTSLLIHTLSELGATASATIFTESSRTRLPVCLVAIRMNHDRGQRIMEQKTDSNGFWRTLLALNDILLDREPRGEGGIFYRRVARVYRTEQVDGRDVATVYLLKPAKERYWTRSMALRDGDEIAADALSRLAPWGEGSSDARNA